jgi:membrane protease YdiL (CAAX protease family)
MQSIPPLLNPPVNRRRWWIHLLVITGYLVVVGVLGMGREKSRTPALLHTARGLLMVCGFEALIFGTVFGLAWCASRASRDELRLRWRGTFGPVGFGMLYSVGLRLSVLFAVLFVGIILVATHLTTPAGLQNYLLANRPDVETLVDISALRNNPAYFWLTVTVVSFVVAGLREELWRSAFLAGMRALWPQYFGTRAGQMGAVVIGAVIFGSAHLSMGVLAAAMAGLLGIGLGAIMVWHRSIWPAVIAHGLFDATSFALLPVALHYLPK